MANTKKLDRAARKQAKRKMRRDIKQKVSALKHKERKEFRKFEGTVKQFFKQQEAKAKAAEAAAAAAAAPAGATPSPAPPAPAPAAES